MHFHTAGNIDQDDDHDVQVMIAGTVVGPNLTKTFSVLMHNTTHSRCTVVTSHLFICNCKGPR